MAAGVTDGRDDARLQATRQTSMQEGAYNSCMTPPYQLKLAGLREAFPTPVSDPVHDGYVVFSLLRTLDRVDALKSQAPILGTPREPDYAAAAEAALADQSQTVEAVIPQLVEVLGGMPIFGHPRSQVN